MLFEKPSDVRYVDMAIWIDEHAYSEDCDDLKLYEYLYHLVNMFAHKHKFFKKVDYYDDFGIYASSYLFGRIKNPKQFRLKENGDPAQSRITSILNYIKHSIFGLKTNFCKSAFCPLAGVPDEFGEDRLLDMDHHIALYRSYHDFNSCEFALGLKDLPRCVRETCRKAPCVTTGNFANVYLSVLLTILNQITLPNKVAQELKEDSTRLCTNEFFVDKLYQPEEPLDNVILYELEPSMASYVLFLANRSKKTLARDLSSILQTWEPSDAVIANLLQAQVEQSIGTETDES